MTTTVSQSESAAITRDFTIAVFVVNDGRVLLHLHAKLGRWLPPGGHIEPNELPDDAAVREVFEETGVRATLLPDFGLDVDCADQPRQLCRPAGIQLATIRPGHEHIDLVYLALGEPAEPRPGVGWYGPEAWNDLDLTQEVRGWCQVAIERVSGQ